MGQFTVQEDSPIVVDFAPQRGSPPFRTVMTVADLLGRANAHAEPHLLGPPLRSRMAVPVSSLVGRDSALAPVQPDADRTFTGLDAPRRRLIASGAAMLTVGRDSAVAPVGPEADRTFTGLDAPRRRLIASGAAMLTVGSLAGAAIMFSDPVSVPAGAQAPEGGYPGRTVPGSLHGLPGGLATIGGIPLAVHPVVFSPAPGTSGSVGLPAFARGRGVVVGAPIGAGTAPGVVGPVTGTPAPGGLVGGVVGGGGGLIGDPVSSVGDRLGPVGGPVSALGDTVGGRHALPDPIGSLSAGAVDSLTVSSLTGGLSGGGSGGGSGVGRHRAPASAGTERATVGSPLSTLTRSITRSDATRSSSQRPAGRTATAPRSGLVGSATSTLTKATRKGQRTEGSSRWSSTNRRHSGGDPVSSVAGSLLGGSRSAHKDRDRDDDRDDDRGSARRSESKRDSDGDSRRGGSGKRSGGLGSLLSGHDD